AQLQPAALLRIALFSRSDELAQIDVPATFAAKGGLRVGRLQLLRVAMGARYGDVSRALRHRTSKQRLASKLLVSGRVWLPARGALLRLLADDFRLHLRDFVRRHFGF